MPTDLVMLNSDRNKVFRDELIQIPSSSRKEFFCAHIKALMCIRNELIRETNQAAVNQIRTGISFFEMHDEAIQYLIEIANIDRSKSGILNQVMQALKEEYAIHHENPHVNETFDNAIRAIEKLKGPPA